ncbi:hypothetical protein BH10PSE6_BH10PSE6_46130 [soil metagenome]
MPQRDFPRRALFGAALVLPLAACDSKGMPNLFGGNPPQAQSRGDRMVRWLYNTGTERMMAPDALTLMRITNEGRDIPVKLLGENGSDGRYVIALVSIRKVYEFVLHRFQNEVFVFHNCDRSFKRLTSVRYARNGKPTVITDAAFAEADFQQQLAFWVDRMPGR